MIREGLSSSFETSSARFLSSFLICTAKAACAGAGRNLSGGSTAEILSANPRRFNPASATMMALSSPLITLLIRVSTFPLSGTVFRSFLISRSWVMRRRLEVPTVAPAGRSSIDFIFSDATRTSATKALFGIAAMIRPGVSDVGKSLKLWTARSALSCNRAFSTSEVKKPTDSDLYRKVDLSRSPSVEIFTMEISVCGDIFLSDILMISVCASASLLARVAILIGFIWFSYKFIFIVNFFAL